ncbi:FAD-dependent oxidoreductase [Streptomyces sp. NPDC001941]|uniref:FAD-dependent oxidoreductase n=1 Tax=Streptomyces sp. NPDC001941 TaxID=3154659 RepID=UPI0033349610
MRIAIVGAGLTGLALAWLLEPDHEVQVLESSVAAGGNIHSTEVHVGASTVIADLGTQYLPVRDDSCSLQLLKALGLASNTLTPVPATVTICATTTSPPLLVSPHQPHERVGFRTRRGAEAWQAYRIFLEAAAFHQRFGSWASPLSRLLDTLPIRSEIKCQVIYPLLTHSTSCEYKLARDLSARAASEPPLVAAPHIPEHLSTWLTLAQGMGQIARTLQTALKAGTLRTGARVTALRRHAEHYDLIQADGTARADAGVLAIPAPQALDLLATLPGTIHLQHHLARFPYAQATVALHQDPRIMPADRRFWSTVNITTAGELPATTQWYNPAPGADLFKSWLTPDTEPPRHILARRSFQHFLPTTDAIRARNALAPHQGRGNLYLAGSYLATNDSQESAVRSALATAGAIGLSTSNTRADVLRAR